jgi:hypothetical protein
MREQYVVSIKGIKLDVVFRGHLKLKLALGRGQAETWLSRRDQDVLGTHGYPLQRYFSRLVAKHSVQSPL